MCSVGAYGVTQQQSAILHEAWSGVFRVDPPKKFDGVPGKHAHFRGAALCIVGSLTSYHVS